jgi:predicted MFS family arabinose efflux permease
MTFLGGLASTFGMPLAQFLIDHLNWRGALLVMAGLMLLSATIHWIFVPGPTEAPVPIVALPDNQSTLQLKKSPLGAAVRIQHSGVWS